MGERCGWMRYRMERGCQHNDASMDGRIECLIGLMIIVRVQPRIANMCGCARKDCDCEVRSANCKLQLCSDNTYHPEGQRRSCW